MKKKNLSVSAIIMAIYYPGNNCDTDVPEHLCDPCAAKELGGVRAAAFIKEDFTFTDPESAAEWTAGIVAGDIIMIPQTSGSFDGGTPVEGKGFGDNETELDGYAMVVQFNDPNYIGNCAFYDGLKNNRNAYKFAWKTETQVHLSDKTVTVIPRNPHADDLKQKVVWDVQVKWSQQALVCPYDAPDVFTCTMEN